MGLCGKVGGGSAQKRHRGGSAMGELDPEALRLRHVTGYGQSAGGRENIYEGS